MAKKKSERIEGGRKSASDVDGYSELAQHVAERGVVVPPKLLTGDDRRLHVRATIREDHETRIEHKASGTQDKFDKLADSLFSFFRGTALLFYRDMVGEDANMPTVMALGDVHPENFGIMPDRNGAPIFGVNDFDETIYAPFTWDIKRGVVGFWLAAHEEGGLKRKKRRKVVRKFVMGYLKAMRAYAENATERDEEWRRDNSPEVIKRLFEEAEEKRKSWLWDDYLKGNGRGFRSDEELQPLSGEIDKFQKAINELAKANGIKAPERVGELKVKDVCVRHGQGTASLGLPRYYVLIEGPSKDATDDVIVEFKRARRSALEGLTPPSDFEIKGSKAGRIQHGQSVHLAHGDIFYGAVKIDGDSYMSRERAPFRDDIDLDDLDYDAWKDYAEACGAALAQAHALSDDLGEVDYDVEPSIVRVGKPKKLFIDDMVRFAETTAKRTIQDHGFFKADHKLGAFHEIDRAYR